MNNNGTSIFLVLILLLLVGLIGLIGAKVSQNRSVSSSNVKNLTATNNEQTQKIPTYESEGQIYKIKAKITEKRKSCSKEVLDSDGNIETKTWVCDAGNAITVDGITIYTGGGMLSPRMPTYVTDIDSIHAGDEVEVQYIIDKDKVASTNCKSCYIKKL